MQKDSNDVRHLNTKVGTFWILESSSEHKTYLGLNEDKLGEFKSQEEAAQAVYEQKTGELMWDCQSKIRAPKDLSSWPIGQPSNWN